MSTALDQRTGPYAALLLRVMLGVLFIAHLYWGDFATNGYPWFVPYYVISAEFVGALCLIPGFYARWAALYAVPMMLGAARFWSLRKGFYFAAAGSELPVVWSVMLRPFMP
jgi:putative oxidoreductase